MTTGSFEQLQQDAVYALAGANGTLFAARASGLYRSADGGQSWFDALMSAEIEKPAAVTAVAAHGDGVFAASSGAILRSDDGGASWQAVGLTAPPPTVVAIVVSPDYASDRTVIAATAQDGVFVSTDGGASWVAWNYGLVDLNVNALALSSKFGTDHTVLVGTESGIFRSRNGGRSWREVDFPMASAPVVSLSLSTEGGAFAGTERSGLWQSTDFGAHWTPVGGELTSAAVQAIQAHEGDVWLLLEDGVMRSTGGGNSWQQDAWPLPSGKMSTAFLPDAGANMVIVGFADGDLLRLNGS